MKPCFALSLLVLLTSACSSEKSDARVESTAAESTQPNVLLICIDDLRPELKSFGVDYISSPHIDALAAEGVGFRRHYVQAPTCGASRYAMLTGQYGGSSNTALFDRAKNLGAFPPSMPAWFRQHGYTTVSVGKVSHHPGGRGGPDWDDEAIPEMPNSWDRHILDAGAWQHPRGWMHGLAHGEIRGDATKMDGIQLVEGPDTVYPDGINTEVALKELETLAAEADEKPFFMAFGILRPHLPFGAPAKYMEPYAGVKLPATPHPEKPTGRTTWHKSGEFYKYNLLEPELTADPAFAMEVRRHYAACVSYADEQVGRVLQRLDELGQRDNTIVVLWGDHGWHLGEHDIWGKHALFEESLRSPLIVSYPGMANPGEMSDALVETVDVFPTLTELAGLPTPKGAVGNSLTTLIDSPGSSGRPAVGYFKKARTIRTDTHRLIAHDDGFMELYDHRSAAGETENLAEAQPELANELLALIEARL
jgi:iduronate 2-sulfatase